MSLDANQNDTFITVPDHTEKLRQTAITPQAHPKIDASFHFKRQGGDYPTFGKRSRRRNKLSGLPLAWLGMKLLGYAIGISTAWYLLTWIIEGQQPLTEPHLVTGLGMSHSTAILPPTWLLAIVGFLTLISICMMVVGTQDDTKQVGVEPNPQGR